MKARMEGLERQKAEITARLLQAPADIPDVHPNLANIYRLRVERFTETLDDPGGGRQAAEAQRSLIGEIVLTPGEKRGEVNAELRGELFGILNFVKGEENQRDAEFMPPVAASPDIVTARSCPDFDWDGGSFPSIHGTNCQSSHGAGVQNRRDGPAPLQLCGPHLMRSRRFLARASKSRRVS